MTANNEAAASCRLDGETQVALPTVEQWVKVNEELRWLRGKETVFQAFCDALRAMEPHMDEPTPHIEALLDKVKEVKAMREENARLRTALAGMWEVAFEHSCDGELCNCTRKIATAIDLAAREAIERKDGA